MTALREYVASLAQPTLTAPGPRRYDEVIAADGSLRPGWRRMAEAALDLTAADLRRVDADIVRTLADDGVTYARPGGGAVPWRLDPVPLVLDPETWRTLEVGLAQRAELLNAVLQDLYGERRLLRDGIVPAAVVAGHAGFLRAMARPSAHDPRPLVLSATDLGRDADGAWRVLGDRTQAPSGLGYALENRRVLSRVLPELYRQADLHRVAPYLRALRSSLLQQTAGDQPDPRVVVLSPGPHSETAYDQAAIATHLGLPLVQGSDLVVRDGWVLLRTLGRLERVDVIVRRVDAAWSDPLELRGDSHLGVAGLAAAVRRGRVRLVNGLGAGVVESPGLQPYLPAACEHLLGETLRLPSARSWWCGDDDARAHVLDHLDSLLVRTLDGTAVPEAADRLRSRIVAEPHRYVGQERLPLSQAPAWITAPGERAGGDAARPRPVSLRMFTLRYGSAYRPLHGGMATIRDGDRSIGSKDVWVLKTDPAEADQGLVEVLAVTNVRALPTTVPRVLDGMYWSGRYAERAEDTLRLLIAAHGLSDDYRARPRTLGFVSLDVAMGALHRLAGVREDDLDGLDGEFRSLLLDAGRPGSVAQSLQALRDALSGVRDQLSPDIWRVFGATDRAAQALHASPYSHQIAESAGRMLTGVLSIQGVSASMIRDAGWHMIGCGRHLERSLQLTQVLQLMTQRRALDVDRELLGVVLLASESAVTYRRRYRDSLRAAGVVDLLVKDPDNPRSLVFALARLREHLLAQPASTGSTRAERLLDALITEVEEAEVATLAVIDGEDRPYLQALLTSTATRLHRIGEAIEELHFATGPAPRRFGSLPTLEVV